ncbi:MAG: hypothetical protein ACXWB2_06400 [Acidimicrobiales bacterium]
MSRSRIRALLRTIATIAIPMTLLAITATAGATTPPPTKPDSTHFSLFPNPVNLPCLRRDGDTRDPSVEVDVKRGKLNDTLTLRLHDFKSDLDFDVFTVQNSNQQADGSAVTGFTNFGLAWYQSDLHSDAKGHGRVQIQTILLDQIFGFDPAVALAPTNTFHVGFWFNNPADAAECGFTGVTPFNGEHQAGPLAFISRPDATTGLGPLCTDPSSTPGTCNP